MLKGKNFWIYGPDGKPISDQETDGNHPTSDNGHHRQSISEGKKVTIKFWFEIAALGAAVVGVPFLVFQSCQLTKATNAAIQQVQMAQNQLVLSRLQIKSSEDQLSEMRDQRMQDERAWVNTYECVARTNKDAIGFLVTIKNTGRTPALNVSNVTFVGTGFNIKDLIPVRDLEISNSIGTLGPGTTGDAYSGLLSNEDVPYVLNHQIQCYIFGTIAYDDIFKHHHWSQYCYSFNTNEFMPTNIAGPLFKEGFHSSSDDIETNIHY